jgi:tRNA threonylcarbamoyladenosine biosynthesis protein TsaE
MKLGDIISLSPEMTRSIGEGLGSILSAGEIVACSGELGAGKTLFIQGLAKGLGVDPAVPVTSPTYTLVQEYPGPRPLFHFDFYRLARVEEVMGLGYEEYFYDEGVTAVEWPEKFPQLFPRETLWVGMERMPQDQRRISFQATEGQVWEKKLNDFMQLLRKKE